MDGWLAGWVGGWREGGREGGRGGREEGGMHVQCMDGCMHVAVLQSDNILQFKDWALRNTYKKLTPTRKPLFAATCSMAQSGDQLLDDFGFDKENKTTTPFQPLGNVGVRGLSGQGALD